VKQEVEIRIESIKIELDNLGVKFFEQLEDLREKKLNENGSIHSIEQTEFLLEKLRNEIEKYILNRLHNHFIQLSLFLQK
jgi:hypothetical protein